MILHLIGKPAIILAAAALGWLAVSSANAAKLNVSATVLPTPITVNAAWIAQSPSTHWPEHAANVRMDRRGDVVLVTVSF